MTMNINIDRKIGNHFGYCENIEGQMRVSAAPNKLRKFVIEKLPERESVTEWELEDYREARTWELEDEACYVLKCFIKDEVSRQWEPIWCWKTEYRRECVAQRDQLIATGKEHGDLIRENLQRL